MHGYQAIDKVAKSEFVEYYAHVSATCESDSSFAQLVENVWNMDNRDNPNTLPFAGTRQKVLTVDHKQRYLQDNFKGEYGQTKSPFGVSDPEKSQGDSRWSTTSNRHYQ